MARPLRIEFPGGMYHVIVRGNERKAVFRDDADREFYLRRVAHYRKKFDFRLLAYCLMGNHVHLAIETGQEPLSRTMAGLQSSYTQYFNRRHRRSGHLFQGRYKAFLVEKDPYALALLRYLHENPVKAGIVAKPEEYLWSSDRDYRRGRGSEWLDVDRLLGMLGRKRSTAIKAYRLLMREEVETPYEEVASWGQAVKGDRPFADLAFQKIGEPKLPRKGLTVETVAREVARRREALAGEDAFAKPGAARGARACPGGLDRPRGWRHLDRASSQVLWSRHVIHGQSRSKARRADKDRPGTRKVQRTTRSGALLPTCHLARLTPIRPRALLSKIAANRRFDRI